VSSSIGRYLRHHHLGLIAVFIALGGGAYAATQPGADGDIDACIKKKSGALLIQKKAKCKKGTKPIAWAQEGPQGPQGATGPAGAAGTARAYGRVAIDGTLTDASSNATASRVQTGVFCINVSGVNVANSVLNVTVDYNNAGQQFGTTQFDAGADPMLPSGSNAKFANWDSIPNYCPAGQFEVRTFEQRMDPFANQFQTNSADASFSFVVP
jgi:hypothetical protein